MRFPFLPLATATLLSLLALPVRADVVTLKNGDRLTGTVKQLVDGKLTFATAQAGTVTLAVSNIRSIVTDEPVRLSFKDGTRRQARLLPAAEGTEGEFILDENGTRTGFALSDLLFINPSVARWTGSASANLSLLDNLIRTRTVSATVSARYQPRGALATIDSAYLHSRQGGTVTQDMAFLDTAYSFGDKAGTNRPGDFWFINSKFRRDGIQNLDFRSLLGAGVGYVWPTSRNGHIRGELGLSHRYERFAETTNHLVSFQIGYALDFNLPTGAKFRHSLTFYPSVSDLGNNYLLTQIGLEKPLMGALYLDLRFLFDNTTNPGEGAAAQTRNLVIGLGYRF